MTTAFLSFATILASQALPEAVKLETQYWSYVNGEAVLHPTRAEALARSKHIEKRVVNGSEFEQYTALVEAAEATAYTEWYAGFRQAYARYNNAVFGVMYNKALALAERKNLRDTNINDKTAELFAGLVEYTDAILTVR